MKLEDTPTPREDYGAQEHGWFNYRGKLGWGASTQGVIYFSHSFWIYVLPQCMMVDEIILLSNVREMEILFFPFISYDARQYNH